MINNEIKKTDLKWQFDGIPRTIYSGINSVNWLSDDTEQLFDKNKPDGWTKESITYDFNSHGYRSIEFEKSNDFTVASFGCSITLGIGVPHHTTWTEQFCRSLSKQLNKPVKNYNFGWPGVSVDFICRTMYQSLPHIDADLVLILLPLDARIEYCDEHGYTHRGRPTKNDTTSKKIFEYYNEYLYEYNFLKNFEFIKTMLTLHNIPWLISTWDEDNSQLIQHNINYTGLCPFDAPDARDMMHPGVSSHAKISKMFLNGYNKKP